MPKIKFTIITLFPEAIKPYLDSSMLYKAQARGIITIDYVNLRDFGLGPHKSVDDTPYGGGDGMLLRCEPAFAAIESVKKDSPAAEVIIPTPVGQVWNQTLARQFAGLDTESISQNLSQEALESAIAKNLAPTALTPKTAPEAEFEASNAKFELTATQNSTKTGTQQHNFPDSPKTELRLDSSNTADSVKHYIIFCPHYEGYDERILSIVDHKISLGNYVLTGGELPALIIIDSVTRLLPGVLGGATSADIESFSDGDNLEFPQYTKPAEFRGMKVPEVLLSGHHGKVAQWRQENSGKAESA